MALVMRLDSREYLVLNCPETGNGLAIKEFYDTDCRGAPFKGGLFPAEGTMVTGSGGAK